MNAGSKLIAIVLFCGITISGKTQEHIQPAEALEEVEIKAYYFPQSLHRLTNTAHLLKENDLNKTQNNSLVTVLNTVPGVRMEERSPASYRLSIRGSMIRSPFGVRNIKIYLNDFPFTDAGGNTYLNILDPKLIQRMEILKGPQSSFFGAGTGGTILIDPVGNIDDTLRVNGGLNAGSYWLLHQHSRFHNIFGNKEIQIAQGYQQYDGYRDHSAMQRGYLHTSFKWNYLPRTQLRALLLASDLRYQTPGGLTFEQFKLSPRMARPSTTAFPGAIEQKSGVYNKTAFLGIANEAALTADLRQVISLFGSITDFKNPFITNFEERIEKTYGARTYVEFSQQPRENFLYKITLGAEGQQTLSDITNFGNKLGERDTVQSADKVNAGSYFIFERITFDLWSRLMIEASASLNYFYYEYKTKIPVGEADFTRRPFAPQFMPRLGISFLITENINWRASASRGYSPPTIAEVRPSNRTININLKAESGWNYETGIRYKNKDESLWIDLCAYYFRLENTIVRRMNDQGEEFFVNAGATDQKGIELQFNTWILRPGYYGILQGIEWNEGVTLNSYYFKDYQVNENNYSGNFMTGVPKWTSSQGIKFLFVSNYQLFLQHNYVEAIPLNDANSEYAEPYHLVQLRGSWKVAFDTFRLEIFAIADNLLDQDYSLGNDLNAAGGRYYNPAAPRNYSAGVNVIF